MREAPACCRCVRRDRFTVCVPPPAGSRQRKCGRCSAGGYRCEPDPALSVLQLPIFSAGVSGQGVGPAFATWEVALRAHRLANPPLLPLQRPRAAIGSLV